MRVFIMDTSNMGPELQAGVIGVVGSTDPSVEEKRECVEIVSRYAKDGWAIAADPLTSIGRLAALTAEAACVPFLAFGHVTEIKRTMAFVAKEEPGMRR
jgi:hypothetical protein